MSSAYITRQPIIAHTGSILAYDLQYSDPDHHGGSERAVASSLITSILSTVGVKSVLGDRMGFIRVDHKFLLSDLAFSVPKELFVLSLSGSVIVDEHLIERVQQLKEKGFILALDDVTRKTGPLQKFTPILPYLSFFKIDIRYFPEEYLRKLKQALGRLPIELIATHVENSNQYAITRSLQFDYVQGYYFAEPDTIEKKGFDPKTFVIIQIYNQLMNDETSLDQLVQTFETNHDLTIQLLQYINSKAFSLANNISNIKQVLALLGRQPLAQWLMLLIYGKSISTSTFQQPLLLMVKNRTELMQELFRLIKPQCSKSELGEAYFVGVMSLSSAVLGMPLRLIIKEMHVSEHVKAALLEKTGLLGQIFETVKAIEKSDLQHIEQFAADHNIPMPLIQKTLIRVIECVNQFEKDIPKNF